MSEFQKFIGMDNSGGGTPLTRTAGLQVYVATNDRLPKRMNPPSTPKGHNRNWCREEGQTYYFAWYLFCPTCKAMYMVEEAKEHVGSEQGRVEETDGSRSP